MERAERGVYLVEATVVVLQLLPLIRISCFPAQVPLEGARMLGHIGSAMRTGSSGPALVCGSLFAAWEPISFPSPGFLSLFQRHPRVTSGPQIY